MVPTTVIGVTGSAPGWDPVKLHLIEEVDGRRKIYLKEEEQEEVEKS